MEDYQKEIKFFIPTKDNKHHIEDYPYGFRERCERFDWLEAKPKFGVRHVYQTKYNGRLNKPKKDTYYELMVCYLNDEGHLKMVALWPYAEKEKKEKFAEILEGIEQSLPDYWQKWLDKYRGLAVEETVAYKFGKLDKSYGPFKVCKLTFDADRVKNARIYQAIAAAPQEVRDSLFDNEKGGFRIFLNSLEVGLFTKEHFESWAKLYANSIDPYAEQAQQDDEGEKRFLKLYAKVKKELPVEQKEGKRDFDKKHLYKWSYRSFGGESIYRFINAPCRVWCQKYKFKRVGAHSNDDGLLIKYPVIREGYLVDSKPDKGFIINSVNGYFSERWRKSLRYTDNVNHAHVFYTKAQAEKFHSLFLKGEDIQIQTYNAPILA